MIFWTMLHIYRLGNRYIFVCLQIKYHPIARQNLDINQNLDEILYEIREFAYAVLDDIFVVSINMIHCSVQC